jgi:hypothetical protein
VKACKRRVLLVGSEGVNDRFQHAEADAIKAPGMTKNTLTSYLSWISPQPGDPTYGLLRAHLLIEDLLREYLIQVLPHAAALKDARLTFTQRLAIAMAASPDAKPDAWIWKGIKDLNTIRNDLAHVRRSNTLDEKIRRYVEFLTANLKSPVPDPVVKRVRADQEPTYLQSDIATMDLHSRHPELQFAGMVGIARWIRSLIK